MSEVDTRMILCSSGPFVMNARLLLKMCQQWINRCAKGVPMRYVDVYGASGNALMRRSGIVIVVSNQRRVVVDIVCHADGIRPEIARDSSRPFVFGVEKHGSSEIL